MVLAAPKTMEKTPKRVHRMGLMRQMVVKMRGGGLCSGPAAGCSEEVDAKRREWKKFVERFVRSTGLVGAVLMGRGEFANSLVDRCEAEEGLSPTLAIVDSLNMV